jgi:hypothetical protein
MPSLAATRRAVCSRCAVMIRADRRACSSIAAGAVSGVPLSRLRRVDHVKLDRLCGLATAQLGGEAQGGPRRQLRTRR